MAKQNKPDKKTTAKPTDVEDESSEDAKPKSKFVEEDDDFDLPLDDLGYEDADYDDDDDY
ncbi:MAG: hypothetical protein ABIP95_00915 [Pelobium sp.]